MSENTAVLSGVIVVALALVAIVGGIIWGTNQAQVLGNEVKLSCIEQGGTWLDVYSICVAPGQEVAK